MFKPKLFSTLKNYSKKQFLNDLSAGTIVGIIALPLAIAFAIASGISPEKGLITAIIAGFLISLLGGSRVQIGGPTGAFVILVSTIVSKFGLNGLIIATVLAGIFLVIMGLAKFGTVIKFIPYPVIVGFTTGIAFLIFFTQVKDFFGLKIIVSDGNFFLKLKILIQSFPKTNFYALSIGLGSLFIIIFWKKIYAKIPGSLIAIILSVVIMYVFKLPVETIGSRFGKVNLSFSLLNFSAINIKIIKELLSPAFAIAVLAGIESLLSAVVADGMINSRHDSNTELIAQGFANIGAGILGGIPATGAIARTAANVKNGGRTPIAGIIHSLVLLIIILLLGNLASKIPMACLAAILINVAYNMSEWRLFVGMRKSPRSDFIVLLTTFVITIIIDLVIAIQIGLVLAFFLFIRRMSNVTDVNVITRELKGDKDIDEEIFAEKYSAEGLEILDNVEIYEVKGPFFFGAADKFKEAMKLAEKPPLVRIIRLRHVPAIDATGLKLLEEIFLSSKKDKITFILSGINPQPLKALEKSGLLDRIGKDFVYNNIEAAIKKANSIVQDNNISG